MLRLDLSMPGLPQDTGEAVVQVPAGTDVLSETDMRDFQRRNIVRALKQSNWRVSGKGGAAELLGVRPTTLADRIRSYGIERPAR